MLQEVHRACYVKLSGAIVIVLVPLRNMILSVLVTEDCELHPNVLCCVSAGSTLSEETAHPNVYNHLSQLSVNIKLSGLFECISAAHSGDFPFIGMECQLSPQS